MKAKVLRTFNDLKGKKIRRKGEIIEVTKKRFEEINSTKHGQLVKAIKDKNEKKVKK